MAIEKKETFVQVLDKQLRVQQFYQASGKNKPTLVFLHEGLGSIELWKDFPQKVMAATGLNAMLYDRQGHGHSDAMNLPRPLNYLEVEAKEYLPALLQQLKIERPILIGHSDGGTIALIYAALHSVVSVVTAAAHVLVEDITIEGIQHVVAGYDAQVMGKKLEKYHGEKANTLFKAWSNTWLNPYFRAWNVAHYLDSITCPVLILQGKKDEYATDNHLHLIVERIGSNAKGILIDDCKHSPHIQAADFFMNSIRSFVI